LDEGSYIIGITGHRRLPLDHLPTLTKSIREFFKEKTTQYGAGDITVLSPLAEGADMLCARLALSVGFRLVVPLPMSVTEYRKDFSETAAGEFDSLLSLTDQLFVVPPAEPLRPNPARGFFYRQAGIYVVKNCDVLLAVWDGEERDTPDGAGTWETVKIARDMGNSIRYITI